MSIVNKIKKFCQDTWEIIFNKNAIPEFDAYDFEYNNIKDLRSRIEFAINCESAENGSGTPDWILAEYLIDCLAAWDKAVQKREKWYNRDVNMNMNPAPDPDNSCHLPETNVM